MSPWPISPFAPVMRTTGFRRTCRSLLARGLDGAGERIERANAEKRGVRRAERGVDGGAHVLAARDAVLEIGDGLDGGHEFTADAHAAGPVAAGVNRADRLVDRRGPRRLV